MFRKRKSESLNEVLDTLSEITLIAAVRLGESPAFSIFEVVEGVFPKTHFATVYSALERMALKGYFTTRLGEPQATRGGRARKYYTVTDLGLRVLNEMEALRADARGEKRALPKPSDAEMP